MSIFDQRNQTVNYQYNAANDINFGDIKNIASVAIELEKLSEELSKASALGVLDSEVAIEAEAKLKKAIVQSQRPSPNKISMIDNLNSAKALIEGAVAATGLVSGFVEAVEMIKRLF